MGLLVSFEQSHRYSFNTPVKAGFKISLVPSMTTTGGGRLHYIVLIDVSGSMRGEKLETAKKALSRLLELLPGNSYITIIGFGFNPPRSVRELAAHETVEDVRSQLQRVIEGLRAENGTPLYAAIQHAFTYATQYREPGYIVLLTDGKPTDVEDLESYKRILWPDNMKAYVVGVGLDYNKELLALLADLGSGVFVHVSEAKLEDLVESFSEAAVSEVAATNIEISVEPVAGRARLLGYSGETAKIPVVGDEPLFVYGEVEIPANYAGVVARIRVSYVDPAEDRRHEEVYEYRVEKAGSREEFLNGINKELYNEYLYTAYMEDAKKLILEGDLAAATKRLKLAENAAAQTRRLDLVEGTRRIRESLEATRGLGKREVEEVTRRVLSEATKRIRG